MYISEARMRHSVQCVCLHFMQCVCLHSMQCVSLHSSRIYSDVLALQGANKQLCMPKGHVTMLNPAHVSACAALHVQA